MRIRMKRTESDIRLPRPPKPNRLRNDIDNIDAVFNFFNLRHALILQHSARARRKSRTGYNNISMKTIFHPSAPPARKRSGWQSAALIAAIFAVRLLFWWGWAALGVNETASETLYPDAAGYIAPARSLVLGGKTFLPPEKRGIGMVFQSYAVWPHMNVFDNVAYPLKIAGVKKEEIKERVEKVLEIVHLSQYKDRAPSELSGGQQMTSFHICVSIRAEYKTGSTRS